MKQMQGSSHNLTGEEAEVVYITHGGDGSGSDETPRRESLFPSISTVASSCKFDRN